MINQMGNNNVSGQQEEEKSSAVEAQEKITQEVVNGDEVRDDDDDKDLHEKVEELAPDDHHMAANETSDGKAAKDNTEEDGVEDLVAQAKDMDETEEKQIEDLVVQTTETESEHLVQPLEIYTESRGEASPVNGSQTVTSSEHSIDGEKLLELNLEEHTFEANDPEIPQQSVGRETKEEERSNSVSNANFKSDDLLDLKSDDQHEAVIIQDECQGEDLRVNEDEKGSSTRETKLVFSSDLRDKGENRVDSSQDVSETQDKSIVLTEEIKRTGKESENEERIFDFVASQPEKLKSDVDSERIANGNASDSNSSTDMENASQIEDDKINNGANLVGNDANCISKKFEDIMENKPTVVPVLTVIEPNQEQENSSEGSLGRIINETNEETTINQVELRRSPSFDFDLSLGARYEDSDQTPLLCHDKAATRSLSSREILTFQTTTSKNHYGRNQAVEVEEKTIRMERSDSDKPRAPFMSLLKKEGNVNAFVELKQEEAPLTEQAVVNSARGSGKRRPRASLFTTCICCAASIP